MYKHCVPIEVTPELNTLNNNNFEQNNCPFNHTIYGMNFNQQKTKEMLIGSIVKDQLPHLTLNAALVERVTTFKLIGVHVSSNLKWAQHVDAISSKVSSQLYFLKHLKCCSVSIDDLGPTMFLHNGSASSARVCLCSLALKSDRRPARGTGVVTEAGRDDCLTSLILGGIDNLQAHLEHLTEQFFLHNVLPIALTSLVVYFFLLLWCIYILIFRIISLLLCIIQLLLQYQINHSIM